MDGNSKNDATPGFVSVIDKDREAVKRRTRGSALSHEAIGNRRGESIVVIANCPSIGNSESRSCECLLSTGGDIGITLVLAAQYERTG